MHEHDVRRLDGRVAAHAAHRDADIRAHEHGRVVDAVADEADCALFAFGNQLFYLFHFILRKEGGAVRSDAQLGRDARRDRLVVAGQHDGAAAHGVEVGDDLFGLRLDLVGDEQRADEGAVVGDVHDGADARLGREFDAVAAHERGVAAEDALLAPLGEDALARDVGQRKALFDLLAVAGDDGAGDGVTGVVLGDGRKAQHLARAICGRNFCHGEVTLGQRARLVEHEGIRLVELFEIVGALDEDAVARGRPDARKEGERDGDDQRAGAGHDEEAERAVYPDGPIAGDQPRHDREQQRRDDDGGRVVLCEFGDKVFRLGLLLGRAFDQLEDLGHRRVVEGLGDAHFEAGGDVDAAADHLAADGDLAREGLARQRAGIQRGRAADDDAVQRDLFAGVDGDDLAHGDFAGVDALRLAAAQHVGVVGTDVHQAGDGPARAGGGVVLEELAHLIKEQHGARLVEALDGLAGRAAVDGEREGAERRHAHQKVFVEHLAVADIAHGAPEHVVADEKIHDEVQREGEHPRRGAAEHLPQRAHPVDDKEDDEQRERDDDADEIFALLARQ